MDIEVKIAGEIDSEQWDKIVGASSHGSIFHTWKWLKIIEKHTHSKLYPLIGVKDSTVIGIFPLFYLKNYGLRIVMSPPPKTSIPYLGPIIVDYDKFKQSKRESIYLDFVEKIDEYISLKIKPHYVFIALAPSLDPRPFDWTDYKLNPLFDYGIDLAVGEESVWHSMDKSARDHVKKGLKESIHVIEGSKDDLLYIYDTLVKRYHDQNKYESMTKRFLLDVYDNFYPNNLRVFVAKYNGNTIGGIISILYKKNIYFWIGAVKPDTRNASPNDMIHWEAIKWACNNGFNFYEETGANQKRLCRFKSKYNPHLITRFAARKYSSKLIVLGEKFYRDVYKKIQFLKLRENL